jgi:hypothetical protein
VGCLLVLAVVSRHIHSPPPLWVRKKVSVWSDASLRRQP